MPTYDELLARIAVLEEQNKRKDEDIRIKEMRIAYLERMLYGSKSDKILSKVPDNQPGLFDDIFQEALDEKQQQIEQTIKDIEAEASKRRAKVKSQPKRPAKYLYVGLEERRTVVNPEGIDLEQYEVIGKDVTRILRREPTKIWVEVIERPIYRKRDHKMLPNPSIVQAPAPVAIIRGNHVGADLLAQLIIDKYRYHLPE